MNSKGKSLLFVFENPIAHPVSIVFLSTKKCKWLIPYGIMQIHPNYNDGIDGVHKYLNQLSLKFGEAQYFICQRTTDTAVWVKSVSGKIERSYCIGDGIFLQSGEMTEIEKEIGISNKSMEELTEEQADNYLLPGIEEVLKVASNWSINPNKLNNNPIVPRFGYMLKPIDLSLELKNTIT